jgi:8-oxo-dGTP pyrophosphatase MutT (NUDIX family)
MIMPISEYLLQLRQRVGSDLLLMPSVTVLVRDDRGRVLLVRNIETNIWVAPGGAVDPFETPADAAVREIWEETGLWVEPFACLGYTGARRNST